MKYIQKTGSPYSYSQWRTQVAGTSKSDWREVPTAQKELILTAMIADQGGLCAYTMRRIDDGSSHVEHIKPQSRCRADLPGSDLDYTNLLACFPRDGMKAVFRYGAQGKGNWWDKGGAEFVPPLQPACEQVFRFRLDGEIEAIGNRTEARTTIDASVLTTGALPRIESVSLKSSSTGARGMLHCPLQRRNVHETRFATVTGIVSSTNSALQYERLWMSIWQPLQSRASAGDTHGGARNLPSASRHSESDPREPHLAPSVQNPGM